MFRSRVERSEAKSTATIEYTQWSIVESGINDASNNTFYFRGSEIVLAQLSCLNVGYVMESIVWKVQIASS